MARGSVRARVTATVVAITLVSVVIVVAAVALGVRNILVASARSYLDERLTVAVAAVARGDLEKACDTNGSVVIQVLDAQGKVVATNARALSEVPLVHVESDDDDGVGDDANASDSADDDGYEYEEAEESYDQGLADADDLAAKLIVPRSQAALRLVRSLLSIEGEEALLDEKVVAELSSDVGLRAPYVLRTQEARVDGAPVTVVALASLAQAVDTAVFAARLLLVISLFVLVGSAALTWHMVGRTLDPVEQMRRHMALIVGDGSSRRISVPQSDPDLRALAGTFNELLDRAEMALVEQRRFVSDASHQLKSPVAVQRIMIETLCSHPDATDADKVLDDLAHENIRLQGIVEDLLALARHDEGRALSLVPVDLIDVIVEEVATLAAHAHVPVDTQDVEPVVVRGDARLLGQAVRNLLDNAACYARTSIAVSCTEVGDVARIVVSDDGPGMPAAERRRVLDRFVRLERDVDAARSSTGLGLAVVQGIVEGHGGRVFAEESAQGGAALVMELPLLGVA